MNIIDTIEVGGVIYDLSAKTEGQVVTPEELSAYTYDKETIDQKIASGGSFDPTSYYTKTEVNNIVQSAKTEVEQEIPSLAGYATQEWVENKHYLNENDLNGYATEQWVLDKHYISGVDLSDYATTAYVNTQISAQTNDFVTSGEVSSYTYDKATIDSKIASGGSFDPTSYYTKIEIDNKLDDKLDESAFTPAISAATSGFADSISYNKVTNYMEFFNDERKVFEMDCSPFLIDGMLEDVTVQEVSGETSLVFTFNIDSGQKMIVVHVSDMFNPDNYYQKSDTSGATQLNTEFAKYYKKAETSGATQIDNALNKKQNVLSAGTGISISGNVISASGVTSAQVQTMIDESISGKADDSGVTFYTEVIVPSERGIEYSFKGQPYEILYQVGSGLTFNGLDRKITLDSTVVQTQIDSSISGKSDTTYVDKEFLIRNGKKYTVETHHAGDTIDYTKTYYGITIVSDGDDFIYEFVKEFNTLEQCSSYKVGYGVYFIYENGEYTEYDPDGLILDKRYCSNDTASYIFKTGVKFDDISTEPQTVYPTDCDMYVLADEEDSYTKIESDTKYMSKNQIWCGDETAWSQISGSTEPNTLYLVY